MPNNPYMRAYDAAFKAYAEAMRQGTTDPTAHAAAVRAARGALGPNARNETVYAAADDAGEAAYYQHHHPERTDR